MKRVAGKSSPLKISKTSIFSFFQAWYDTIFILLSGACGPSTLFHGLRSRCSGRLRSLLQSNARWNYILHLQVDFISSRILECVLLCKTFVLFLLWNRMMVSCCFVDPQKSMGRVGIPTGMRVPKPRVISEFHRFAHDLRSGNITILDRKVIGRNGSFLHNSSVGSGRVQNPTRPIFTQKFFSTYWDDKVFCGKKYLIVKSRRIV